MIQTDDDASGHPARRKEIVDAARSIAASQGWPAVTVRAIAARIGCSAPAIYQYFRDKDAVLTALAAEARTGLEQTIEDAAVDIHGPAKRLLAAVQGIWRFAVENRELYAVMYGLDGLRPFGNHGGDAPQGLQRIAEELVSKRDDSKEDGALADRIAATIHGFAALALANRFPGGTERAAMLLQETVDDMVKGLGRH